jgi:hypothetical protein
MRHIIVSRPVFSSHIRTRATDHRRSKDRPLDVHYTRLPYILSQVSATAVVLLWIFPGHALRPLASARENGADAMSKGHK